MDENFSWQISALEKKVKKSAATIETGRIYCVASLYFLKEKQKLDNFNSNSGRIFITFYRIPSIATQIQLKFTINVKRKILQERRDGNDACWQQFCSLFHFCRYQIFLCIHPFDVIQHDFKKLRWQLTMRIYSCNHLLQIKINSFMEHRITLLP